MNSKRPSIQFTMGGGRKRRSNGLSGWTHRVMGYHKPTFTGQYLNFNSCHLFPVRKGVIHCLQHWAKLLSDNPDTYRQEMIDIGNNLLSSTYFSNITSVFVSRGRGFGDNNKKSSSFAITKRPGRTHTT